MLRKLVRLKELSIIQYQNVSGVYDTHTLWLPAHAFLKQIAYFSTNPFHVLDIDGAIDFMEGKLSTNDERPISLTFDNGFLDLYDSVYPFLQEHNYPGTVLISPSKVGKSIEINGRSVTYLSWSQLKDMIKGKITIGAYEDSSMNINNIPKQNVLKHISNYKKILEDGLGSEVRYFGVKEGVPGSDIRERLISEGYRAFLTQCPTNTRPDLFSIGRIQVDDDDFNIFLTKISKTYLFFKDKKSWKYIRRYKLDRLVHRLSETLDGLRGIK
jgi:peptidoglycan/xylan/chitin deacetylase (PgdA/CDA1 family)